MFGHVQRVLGEAFSQQTLCPPVDASLAFSPGGLSSQVIAGDQILSQGDSVDLRKQLFS
jgi:hypothetical protein